MKDLDIEIELKEKMSEKIDELLKEFDKRRVETNEEMINYNNKVMAMLDYETECINRLIDLYEDKVEEK